MLLKGILIKSCLFFPLKFSSQIYSIFIEWTHSSWLHIGFLGNVEIVVFGSVCNVGMRVCQDQWLFGMHNAIWRILNGPDNLHQDRAQLLSTHLHRIRMPSSCSPLPTIEPSTEALLIWPHTVTASRMIRNYEWITLNSPSKPATNKQAKNYFPKFK